MAGKIQHTHGLYLLAQKNLESWLAASPSNRSLSVPLEWKYRMERHSREQVLKFMCSDDPQACLLRQFSPFLSFVSQDKKEGATIGQTKSKKRDYLSQVWKDWLV